MRSIKLIIVGLIIFSSWGCAKQDTEKPSVTKLPNQSTTSKLISDAVILPTNLEQYLFLPEVLYIDTREPNQFMEEGHVAGFVNVPFYELIASISGQNTLFKMRKVVDASGKLITKLGDVGSFEPTSADSIDRLDAIFFRYQAIMIISTAGVESTYLANLLIQYDYDQAVIYNVGNFSNAVGTNIAYLDLKDKRFYVGGITAYRMEIEYQFVD